jgi:hypothetical protein
MCISSNRRIGTAEFHISSSPASGRPALHESLFYISVPRWIFLLTFFPGADMRFLAKERIIMRKVAISGGRQSSDSGSPFAARPLRFILTHSLVLR